MEETEKSARREVFNYNRKFKEQLLSIKMKLENLQSEYGCSSNFLLIFEDNVTEKVNLRGRDSLTAGSRGVKRKREDEETTTEETSSTNTPDPSLGLLEPKVELLEPQEQLTEEGSSSSRVPVVKEEEEVKKEMIKQEPIDDVNLAAMIRDETVKISVGNLLLQNNEDKTGLGNLLLQNNKDKMGVGNLILQNNKMGVGNLVLQNNEDKRFSKIDPQLVKNAADARKRDYSMQELLAQAAGGGMFSCGFCEFKTYCSKRLAVHVRSIHGYGAKKLVCRECGFSTLIKQEMGQHMKEHKRDLIKCNVDCSGGGGLMKTQTMSLGFQCSSCPFKSSSKKGIKVHENRIHGKDKQVFGTASSSVASSLASIRPTPPNPDVKIEPKS